MMALHKDVFHNDVFFDSNNYMYEFLKYTFLLEIRMHPTNGWTHPQISTYIQDWSKRVSEVKFDPLPLVCILPLKMAIHGHL